MFTPEFGNKEGSEFHLVANHYLGDDEAISLSISLSIDFNRARIAFGRLQVPPATAVIF